MSIMKKILFILLLISGILNIGCNRNVTYVDKHGNIIVTSKIYPSNTLNSYCTIEIEKCEYFIVNAYGSFTYMHKGNCKNPIHIYNGGNHE